MPENDDNRADASAEKAYAKASEAASAPMKTEPAKAAVVETAKPEPSTAAPVEEPLAYPAEAKAPAKPKGASAKTATPAKRAASKTPRKAVKKKAPARKTAAVGKTRSAPKAAAKSGAPASRPAVKTSMPSKPTPSSKPKEKPMPQKAKISEGIQEAVADAQAKAKKAVEKGGSILSEAGDFTKGNVEAVIESGKILAGGLQSMSKDLVVDSRNTVEMLTSEVKELADVKSPSEFIKVQSDIARKNFDTAIAMGSKNSQAMLKLASDVFAPISGRFSLAAEKVRKAAA